MNVDDGIGEKLYKVASTSFHDEAYFVIVSKEMSDGVIEIEFGTRNVDGSSGDRWKLEETFHTRESADDMLEHLMLRLNARFPRVILWIMDFLPDVICRLVSHLAREDWYIWDFTKWGNLSMQLSHAEGHGFNFIED